MSFQPVKANKDLTAVPRWVGFLRARKNILAPFSEAEFSRKLFEFRILRQRYIVCNAPEYVRETFIEKHDNFDRKSPQQRTALEPILGDGLFASDGELWKERREACAPALRSELLPMFAPIMVETALEVRSTWEAHPKGKPIDILHEMAKLTARIIGRTVFGDDVPEEEAAQTVRGFSKYQKTVEQMSLADCCGIPALNIFTNPYKHWRTRRAAREVQEVIDWIIERKLTNAALQPHSLLDLFFKHDAQSGKCPMSKNAARNESIVMFMAGHETTANTLSWAWYLLDGSPDARRRLNEELTNVLQGRLPTLDDVSKLVYTRAVIEETLRLYPPVPILSRQARRGDRVGSKELEPGTIIVAMPWLLQRHKLYWERPDDFVPERFLPDQPRPDKCLYFPFSVGPRVCLGLRFGLTESILCLAILSQKFAPRLKPGHKVKIDCRLTLRPGERLPMILDPA
jgi:cytochrome P450